MSTVQDGELSENDIEYMRFESEQKRRLIDYRNSLEETFFHIAELPVGDVIGSLNWIIFPVKIICRNCGKNEFDFDLIRNWCRRCCENE